MTFPITAPFAAALTLIFIVLTFAVIFARQKAKVGLGDGGNPLVLQAMRRQANFVENVPLTLLLMALAEAGGSGATLLTLCGSALLLARLIHPFGIKPEAAAHPARIIGATVTNLVQLVLAVSLILHRFA